MGKLKDFFDGPQFGMIVITAQGILLAVLDWYGYI